MRQVLAVVCVLLVAGVVVADKPVRVAPAIEPAVEPVDKLNFKAEVVSFKDGRLTLKLEKGEKEYPLADKAECMNADGTMLKDRAELTKGLRVEVWLTETGKEIKKLRIVK